MFKPGISKKGLIKIAKAVKKGMGDRKTSNGPSRLDDLIYYLSKVHAELIEYRYNTYHVEQQERSFDTVDEEIAILAEMLEYTDRLSNIISYQIEELEKENKVDSRLEDPSAPLYGVSNEE
jgi:hypothetical protein